MITTLSDRPATGTESVIEWTSPDAELWVANADGEYAGMVEFIDGRFEVRNAIAGSVGAATSIPEARAMLEDHVHGRPHRSLAKRSRTSLVPLPRRFVPAPYRRTSAA